MLTSYIVCTPWRVTASAIFCVVLALSAATGQAAFSPDGSYAQEQFNYTKAYNSVCGGVGTAGAFAGTGYRDIGALYQECAQTYWDAAFSASYRALHPHPIIRNLVGPTASNLTQDTSLSKSGESYSWRMDIYASGYGYVKTLSAYPANIKCPTNLPVVSDGSCSCPGTQRKPTGYTSYRCWPLEPQDRLENGDQSEMQLPPGIRTAAKSCSSCATSPSQGNNVMSGDPIHITNGNVYYSETDVVIPASGLSFSRYYNSRESPAQCMRNWRADWVTTSREAVIGLEWLATAGGLEYATATARIDMPDGKQLVFKNTYYSITNTMLGEWMPDASTSYTLKMVRP